MPNVPLHRLFTTGDGATRAPAPVTIRVWHGCTVVELVTVAPTFTVTNGAASPLDTSTPVDIEIDPWAGLISVNAPRAHNGYGPPVDIVQNIDEEPPF
jgi:hypothetical protein